MPIAFSHATMRTLLPLSQPKKDDPAKEYQPVRYGCCQGSEPLLISWVTRLAPGGLAAITEAIVLATN